MLTEPAMDVRGLRIFVGDGCGKTSHSSQTVLHSDFPFETSNLGQVVKGIDKTRSPRTFTLSAETITRKVLRNPLTPR